MKMFNNGIKNLAVLLVVLILSFVLGSQADAVMTMRIQCEAGTICAPGDIITTQNNLPDFYVTSSNGTLGLTGNSVSGTAYLAILLPNLNSLDAQVTVNGNLREGKGIFNNSSSNLWVALGEIPGKNGSNNFDHEFASQVSFSEGAIGGDVSQFKVYDFLLGPYNSAGQILYVNFGGGISGFPTGTIFVAFLEDNNKTQTGGEYPMANASPNSGSLMIVPEPATLLLLGSGLIGVAAFGRRFRKQG